MYQKRYFIKLQIILIVAFFAAMVFNYYFSALRESVDNDILIFLNEIFPGYEDEFGRVEVLKHNGFQIFRNIVLFGIEEYVTFFICLFSFGSTFFGDEYTAAFILYIIIAGYLFLFLQSIAGRIYLEVKRSLPTLHGRVVVLLFDTLLIDNTFGYLIKLSVYILGKIIAFKWLTDTINAIYLKISETVVWIAYHTGTVGLFLLMIAGGALVILSYYIFFAPLIWMYLRFAFYYVIFFGLLAGIIVVRYILGWGLSLPAFLSNEYGFLIFLLAYTLLWKLYEYPIVIILFELFDLNTDVVEYYYYMGHIFDDKTDDKSDD